MRIVFAMVGGGLLAACSAQGPGGLAAFDPDAVIYAGSCDPVPAARECVARFPLEAVLADAAAASERCVALGHGCCEPEGWISEEAALCIAEEDPRLSGTARLDVALGCDLDLGPIFGVLEIEDGELLQGIAVHASTGRVDWYGFGSGGFT